MKKKRRSHKPKSRKKLGMLMGAALMLPGIMPGRAARAQEPLQAPTLRLKYGEYRDRQTSDERMQVHAPMFQFQTPVVEGLDLEVSGMWESMSGASALYLSTMSGASGKGIADHRTSSDIHLTKYFDRFSIAGGGAVSDEDDYYSNGLNTEGKFWTPSKNTIFAAGIGSDWDKITSTNDASLHESRRTLNSAFGITQVLDPLSTAQFNVTFSSAAGYLSDNYKTFDNRPRSRDMLAALVRYVRYIQDTQGSVHVDFRMYRDSWNILSETLDLSFYQPLDNGWMLVPNIRYYSQDDAKFFHDGRLPLEPPENYFSADQRLSDFGEWGGGLKVIKELSDTLSLDLRGQLFHQRSGFHLGSTGATNIEPFTGYFVLVGLAKKF